VLYQLSYSREFLRTTRNDPESNRPGLSAGTSITRAAG
jgi:hypothetical protein